MLLYSNACKSLTRSVVKALAEVALVVAESLTEVALAGCGVVHGSSLAAASHGSLSL